MDTWIDIRRKARECHQEALAAAGGDRRAAALMRAALKKDDLELRMFEPGVTFSRGVYGVLEREYGIVNVAKGQDPADEAVVIAHEIGHNRLHDDATSEVTVRSTPLGGDPVDTGAGRVEGYSPRERQEVQADVFAGECLCPADWLRAELLDRRRRPSDIAAELGLPPALVINQCLRALLLPPLRPPDPRPPHIDHQLDPSQQTAATWKGKPLLVDAGPGTGKTRTLVSRVLHLLDQGVAPSSILALTFSNKAADEMRERLSAVNADAAIQMWIGTFHAFGLELVRKWPAVLGRTGNLRILDQVGSLALLEENLAALPLHHYQNLYEPAYELVNVLRAISRCKDELISPEEYRIEAEAALFAAKTDEERLNAEKAVEVAGIYRVYDEALANANAVDFGDLVWMAARLVAGHPDVQAYVSGFKHVLVDEYQDVNLASARLLRSLCRPDTDLWVVADQRQSIYRFRGAEPTNVTRFVAEFDGVRQSLDTNYRSFAPIIRVFQQFSGAMGGAGTMAGTWNAHRGDGGEATLTVAATLAAEAEAIRDKIEHCRQKGVPYRDQAILARTHLTLARVTGILEQLGVPLLYLGDLFERDEIRDLLSLLAIDAEPGGIGLARVATFPAYHATRDDGLAVIRWCRAEKVSVMDALKRLEQIDGLSANGRVGLAKLGAELDGLRYASPWTFLTTWLLERSDYLGNLCAAGDPKSQQKLLAIYHLLKVCSEHVAQGEASRRQLLDRIRRIEALNQDSSYRAVASEAADIDAVRVMTIHGSKGLEFGAVHFPALATRYMPTNRQANRCPPPKSLARLAMLAPHHDAEEECLFFVGLSRARDFLALSRSQRYTTQNAGASKFLTSIAGVLRSKTFAGRGEAVSLNILPTPPSPCDRYDERDLSVYMQCPARYRYEAIDGLRGGRDGSAYVHFHRCVYTTVRWLEAQRVAGSPVDVSVALERLDAEWQANGPVKHPFEHYYLTAAINMVKAMASAIAMETGQYDRREWVIPVDGHSIVITPDRVLLTPDGAVRIQRIRTGRETKSELTKSIYALLQRGAELLYPEKPIAVEIFYLATATRVAVEPATEEGLEDYAAAIAAIEEGKFAPKPDPRSCPNCQCYFICRP